MKNSIGSALLFALLLAFAPFAGAVDLTDDDDAFDVEAFDLCGLPPRGGVLATFKVGTESFRAYMTNPTAINDAIALWRNPKLRKRIPVARLSCAAVAWNCPWSWHQTPSSVTLAEAAIEVCDGIPSYVEQHCPIFGMGFYCPWSAVLAELRDCRMSVNCPIVPR